MDDLFFLFSQHDHALLSGRFAQHFGNTLFAAPQPRQPTLTAISLHDCGWVLHDDHPTLGEDHLPRDVFENPLPVALQMWSAAGQRLEQEDDYTRLLVSLHLLGLSAFAATRPHTPAEVFELNRFQHREIERQELLRQRLGMRLDRPLKLGLAMDNADEAEQWLQHNHTILQILDRISLGLCCTEVPFSTIEKVVPRPGGTPVNITLRRTASTHLHVNPWPFDQPQISFPLSYRVVKGQPFADDAAFQVAYAAAPIEQMQMTLHGD